MVQVSVNKPISTILNIVALLKQENINFSVDCTPTTIDFMITSWSATKHATFKFTNDTDALIFVIKYV